ncbi:cell division protein ZapA [Thermosulfurimonas sp.]|uniref:cell division protein ZapA n=1 Tax=Thermosulfurimonas sp. TaxID=2080236 RepID=UPI0025DE78BB|nr:cell division protein ZapA [Thermosulfurimonas sp.]
MTERLIEFEFAGNRFTFRADLPEEEIEEILAYLEDRKRRIKNRRQLSPLKQAVVLLLEITAELVRLRREHRLLSEKIGREAVRLSETIERELKCLGCA